MTTTEPAATPAAPAPARPSSARIITARVLVVLGVVLVIVSLLANFVRREALDRDTFRDTSQQLIANDDIRNQVAATMVDQLYANVDVAGALQQRLPDNLQPLAAPLAGLAREAIDRGAQELLARPRVQTLFVDASSLAQAQVKRVLEGDTPRLQTSNGNVVLDLRPLVVQLGDRFGFLGDLDQQLPPNAAQITLLKADNLETAQSVTQGLKVVANWIWIPAILCWAVALWLVPGRRRREVRAIGIGLIIAGIALLVIRSVAGSYLVDNLAQSDSVSPAVDAFWSILSDGLAEGAWVVLVVIGVIADARCVDHRARARARRFRHTVGPWLARPAPRLGRVLRRPSRRRVGAATSALPHGPDPDRARRDRLRGDATPGRAGDGRGRSGGRRTPPEAAHAVAPVARRAEQRRGARAPREAPGGRPPHRGRVLRGEGTGAGARRRLSPVTPRITPSDE